MNESAYESDAKRDPETETTRQQPVNTKGHGQSQGRKAGQQRAQGQSLTQAHPQPQSQLAPPGALREEERRTGHIGGPYGIIRQSRIKDRPEENNLTDSSLKIKIELDLEVEVDLYARVKGDVTIGLM
jgi:hypothetical protein